MLLFSHLIYAEEVEEKKNLIDYHKPEENPPGGTRFFSTVLLLDGGAFSPDGLTTSPFPCFSCPLISRPTTVPFDCLSDESTSALPIGMLLPALNFGTAALSGSPNKRLCESPCGRRASVEFFAGEAAEKMLDLM